jgi:hypothetical protein
MSGISAKNFDNADQIRTPEKSRVEVVNLSEAKVSRFTMQPGWVWSQCIKPIAGTETCQVRHVGAVVSGRMHVTHADGSEADLTPGDAYVLEPGHDASVIGSEPFVSFEFGA